MLLTNTVKKDLGNEKFENYEFENKFRDNRVETLKLSESLKGGGLSFTMNNYKDISEELSKDNPDVEKIKGMVDPKPLRNREELIRKNIEKIYDASNDDNIAIVLPSREDLLNGYTPTLGDYLARFMKAIGIKDIYGVPGGASEALNDTLARHGDLFDSVLTSHEATSSYLAALNTVKIKWFTNDTDERKLDIGVCFTTTRPGIRNLIPGIDYAYMNKRSLVAITAGSMPSSLGKRAFQETDTDILNLFNSITCYNTAITDPKQLIPKLHAAFWSTILHKEPAHINTSSQILNTPISLLDPIIMPKHNIPRRSLERNYSDEVNNVGAEIFKKFLKDKKNPLLYIGLESKKDLEDILDFSDKVGMQFVTSPEGRDIVGFHPNNCGSLGMAGQGSALDALHKSDMVVGINPGAGQFSGIEKLKEIPFLHLATYPDNFGVTAEYADAQILGNPGIIFKKVGKHLEKIGKTFEGENHVSPYYIDYESSIGKDEPVHFADAIKFWREKTPNRTNFHYDIGTSMLAGIHYDQPREKCVSRVETKDGAMTVGIYEALGKAIELKRDEIEKAKKNGVFDDLSPEKAKRKERELASPLVICFTGDGSTLMCSNEFVVARRLGLNMLFIIANNRHLQMVNQGQLEGGKELFCNDLSPDERIVDFTLIAQGSGIEHYKVSKYDDFLELPVDHIINHQGVKLIDMATSLASMPMTQRLIQLKTD